MAVFPHLLGSELSSALCLFAAISLEHSANHFYFEGIVAPDFPLFL